MAVTAAGAAAVGVCAASGAAAARRTKNSDLHGVGIETDSVEVVEEGTTTSGNG
jgi:hypothetical protein